MRNLYTMLTFGRPCQRRVRARQRCASWTTAGWGGMTSWGEKPRRWRSRVASSWRWSSSVKGAHSSRRKRARAGSGCHFTGSRASTGWQASTAESRLCGLQPAGGEAGAVASGGNGGEKRTSPSSRQGVKRTPSASTPRARAPSSGPRRSSTTPRIAAASWNMLATARCRASCLRLALSQRANSSRKYWSSVTDRKVVAWTRCTLKACAMGTLCG
mmetsp:Transcript_28502/g.87483  ORF Transcript_28502/g.87483 Transcript_28502/m.87483 type:complete len:215 (-) Transcript_28502:676-1320(-)